MSLILKAMDIQRHTQEKPWYRKHWYLIPIGLFAAVTFAYTTTQNVGHYQVSADSLAIGEVKQGDFTISVRGSGTLTPRHVRWLAANVSGRVEAIHAKPGAQVKPGDLIVELANPELVQSAEEIAWELEALAAENHALRVSLESQLLNQQAQVLGAKMNHESAKIQFDAEETLLKEGNALVSRLDHQRSRMQTEQYLARWEIEKQRFAKLKETNAAQISASEARYQRLNKSYDRAQQQVNSLNVTATLEGVLQAMPLEAGQRVNIGDNIARLARQDQLIAELQIPERQVNGVAIGQSVLVDTRRSKISGEVIRIDPAVVNGVVQVDVALTQNLPSEARPDLTVDGTIQINALSHTLFVNRPTAVGSQSQTTVYRLTDEGQFAERVTVSFGIGSASELQVVHGLSPGQRIILSDSSAWAHLDRIQIQ